MDGHTDHANTTRPEPQPASEAFDCLNEGDVISIPQYQTNLEVTFVGDFLVGVEFANGRAGASKSLIQNDHSGRVYLTAGTTDKGDVETITVVSRGAAADDAADADRATAAIVPAADEAPDVPAVPVPADETQPAPVRDHSGTAHVEAEITDRLPDGWTFRGSDDPFGVAVRENYWPSGTDMKVFLVYHPTAGEWHVGKIYGGQLRRLERTDRSDAIDALVDLAALLNVQRSLKEELTGVLLPDERREVWQSIAAAEERLGFAVADRDGHGNSHAGP